MGRLCNEYADLFKALSDDTRLYILSLISGESCGCELLEEVEISQPTLSYHMKMLTEAGIVNARKDGAWMRYSINKETLEDMENFLAGLRNNA